VAAVETAVADDARDGRHVRGADAGRAAGRAGPRADDRAEGFRAARTAAVAPERSQAPVPKLEKLSLSSKASSGAISFSCAAAAGSDGTAPGRAAIRRK